MNKKIILVSGDPNSINSEIIFKCWKKLPKNLKKNIFLISNYNLLKDQFKKLKYKINLVLVDGVFNSVDTDGLKIIDVKVNYKNPFKVPRKSASKFVIKSLNIAHKLALNNDVAGIINCPINKKLLPKKNIGVTEFLASKCFIKNDLVAMLIGNKILKVSPLTTHLDLKLVPKKINKLLIVNKIKIINDWFKKTFKTKPKIAILGLNPHNSELRNNSEEKKIIIPAIIKLRNYGIALSGPIPADTIFIDEYKNYDVVVGMYHDQVLAPFKTLYKFNAINITIGLKYVRVSPDHGVAKNKILSKKSNPVSLLKCFDYISNLNK